MVGPSEGDDPYTEQGRREAQQLIDIHDHLRQELRQLRDLGAQVLAGQRAPGEARSAIAVMTMRQNSWTLGGYCQSYCRVVALHHTIEDQAVFPRVRTAAPRAGVVLDRLEQEHQVIAGVLDEVDAALVALVGEVDDQAAMAAVQDAVDLLSDALLSHLSYEENELVEPLARFGGLTS